MFPYCRAQDIALTTFSPLARGALARERDTARTSHDAFQDFYGDDIDREIIRRVRALAARRGVSAAEVALAWVAGSPNRNVPIIGASSNRQIDAAVAGGKLRSIYLPGRLFGPVVFPAGPCGILRSITDELTRRSGRRAGQSSADPVVTFRYAARVAPWAGTCTSAISSLFASTVAK